MKEEWRLIKEAPKYYVSNLGRVKSCQQKQPRILKQKKTKCGYLSVTLFYQTNKRKDYLVHRLVLTYFNPVENMDILEGNHKDENKTNNNIENLEWVSSLYNKNYGNRNDKIREYHNKKVMCVETGAVYNSGKEASETLNICRSSISNCLQGKRNKAGNYHWREISE